MFANTDTANTNTFTLQDAQIFPLASTNASTYAVNKTSAGLAIGGGLHGF
jgi:hypothetical protein